MKSTGSNSVMDIKSEPSKVTTLLLIIGIIFIATNLRSPLTSVGPLIGMLRDNLGISNTVLGLITTIPLLAFGVFSSLSPKLARRVGMERLLFFSLIILTIGIIVRSVGGETMLFTGTILIGLAISVCNVLLPSLIKRDFEQNVGLMTGVYSVSMNLCGAIASGISVPLATKENLGWNGALGVWAILSFISIFLWLPQLRKIRIAKSIDENKVKSTDFNIWKSPIAWNVTFFMGLQSLIFYVSVAWLPEILIQKGISAASAGWILSLMQLAILPITFFVPILAGRMSNQRILVVMTSILYLLGIFGLLYGGYLIIILSVILIGIAVGSSFSLSMMFFSLRTKTAHQSAELSGMAQSIGYLLAAIGPALFGILHVITNGWTVPLSMIMIATILLLISGLGAGRDAFIGLEKGK
ncbi:MFS transporter [Peribacillus psychrosaccharolyticus]|nr:MFS transporter [Peribacillus psychrosaccharolyticus]MEC2054112.1 MFS transporter [Peribacillus psychrosaccharolyticus]MED3742267.1 MFS transporter [Peribacillus psychrosaccharolyticus]